MKLTQREPRNGKRSGGAQCYTPLGLVRVQRRYFSKFVEILSNHFAFCCSWVISRNERHAQPFEREFLREFSIFSIPESGVVRETSMGWRERLDQVANATEPVPVLPMYRMPSGSTPRTLHRYGCFVLRLFEAVKSVDTTLGSILCVKIISILCRGDSVHR